VTAKNGRILGATIVGAHAGELIATWTLALSQALKYPRYDRNCRSYPTLSRNRETRRSHLFFAKFEQSEGAARDKLSAPFGK
jgi:hypothetical protein